MKKRILIIIIIVLIAVILGLYLIVANLGQNIFSGSSFEIQGMKVEVLQQGSGQEVKANDRVTVNYVGMLSDGTKFDSSIDRNTPFTFTLGQGKVIRGWDLGIEGMKVGEKRRLIIPPELAYGSASFLMIPANATLIFEVEMLAVSK